MKFYVLLSAGSTFSFFHVLLGCLALIPLMLVLYYVKRVHEKEKKPKKVSDLAQLLQRHEYEITLYSFDDDVQSIADITAKRFSTYRVSGIVESYGHPVYDAVFHPSEQTVFELGNVLMHAKEVNRVDNSTTVYFFDQHIMRHSDQPEIAAIMNAMAAESIAGKKLLLSVTKHIPADD